MGNSLSQLRTPAKLPGALGTLTALCILSLAVLSASGCASGDTDRLTAPTVTVAPYDSIQGGVLWAVAPMRNESGTTLIETAELTDKLVAACAQVQGVRVLPANRTAQAMRALELREIASASDAKRVAARLGADAIVVGSISAYDPYTPTLGLSLALFTRPGSPIDETTRAGDPRALAMQTSERAPARRAAMPDAPASVVSEHFDGKNHQVLFEVRNFATGRSESGTALNWKRYIASMSLYEEFCSAATVERLVQAEWLRVARLPSVNAPTQAYNAFPPEPVASDTRVVDVGSTDLGGQKDR
ncbi:MAG: hypothetical protein KGS45_08320 [Planctomycetes bacterium]|nr:hypothetical protein [Planctomycetota bacterium]